MNFKRCYYKGIETNYFESHCNKYRITEYLIKGKLKYCCWHYDGREWVADDVHEHYEIAKNACRAHKKKKPTSGTGENKPDKR